MSSSVTLGYLVAAEIEIGAETEIWGSECRGKKTRLYLLFMFKSHAGSELLASNSSPESFASQCLNFRGKIAMWFD
jgi:hypothetical protein